MTGLMAVCRGIRSVTIALLWLAAGLAANGATATPPQRITIEYDMSHNGTAMAHAVETLQHDGKRYSLESEVKGKGLFALARSGSAKRRSSGDVTPAGLKPAEFRDKRGDRPETVARFDWQKGVVLQGEEGRTESQAIPPAETGLVVTDRLSFLWTFAFQGVLGKEVRALLSDGRGWSAFRYAIAGQEILKTPAGDIETLKLVKQKEAGDDRGTEIWLATRRNHLPVRILVTEKDGTRVDQIATRIGG
jgi:hypothetical protein